MYRSAVKFLQCYRTSLRYIPRYTSSLYIVFYVFFGDRETYFWDKPSICYHFPIICLHALLAFHLLKNFEKMWTLGEFLKTYFVILAKNFGEMEIKTQIYHEKK